MTRNDDLQDDRGTFRDENLIAELLSADFVIGDGTGAAFLAVETEFIVVGRTSFGVLQAMRQQQQPSLERDRQKLLLPERVSQHNHGKPEKTFGLVIQSKQFASMFLES